MAKTEVLGTVVSNKMAKSVVVAVGRQVRDGLYGKQLRLTSRFMAHDEQSEAKVGDRVALVPSRPISLSMLPIINLPAGMSTISMFTPPPRSRVVSLSFSALFVDTESTLRRQRFK